MPHLLHGSLQNRVLSEIKRFVDFSNYCVFRRMIKVILEF